LALAKECGGKVFGSSLPTFTFIKFIYEKIKSLVRYIKMALGRFKPIIYATIIISAMGVAGLRVADFKAIKKAYGRTSEIGQVADAFFRSKDLTKVNFSSSVKQAVESRSLGVRLVRKLALVDRGVRKDLLHYSNNMFKAQEQLIKIKIKLMNGQPVTTQELIDALKQYRKYRTRADDDLGDAADGLPGNVLTAPLANTIRDAETAAFHTIHDVRTVAGQMTQMKPAALEAHIDSLLCNEARFRPVETLKKGGRGLYALTIGNVVKLVTK
jgi:hypothetical protein